MTGDVTLTNNSQLSLDGQNIGGAGDSAMTIGGTLTNDSTNGNGIDVGNADPSSGEADTLTVNGSGGLVNSSTSFINIVGLGTLDVANSAVNFGDGAGVETGSVFVAGNGLLEFDGGKLTTVDGDLSLQGEGAQVDDSGALSGNSALTSLTTVAGDFYLQDGASLTTSAGENITISGNGQVSVDGVNIGGAGGSSLTIGGTLTNASTNGNGLDVGNSGITAATTLKVNGAGGLVNGNTAYINIVGSATVQATLNVADAAAGFGTAGVETGSVFVAGNGLLEFDGGKLTTVDGDLSLQGAGAQVDNSGALSGNSALTSLTTVAGDFYLQDGASLTTSAGENLTISGNGQVSVDGVNIGGAGGSSLTIGGTLTNASTNGNGLDVGNSGITAATTLKVNGAGGLVNGNTAYINIVGSATVQATLNVADAAAGFGTAGVETGSVFVAGNALLEFKSGEISTIDGLLQLSGASAGVDDIGTPSGNSALTGLTTVAGSFYLQNGASLATSAGDNLTISGNGQVSVDGVDIGGGGGSSLTIGGTLTNASTNGNGLDVGNSGITAATTLKLNGAAGLVNGNTAYINITGNGSTAQAVLDVANAAAGFGTAGVETGTVSLTSNALLEFKSGEIATIDGLLQLNGASAGVDDIGTPSGNSALTGLTTVAGSFYLHNGASLATSAGDNLTISGNGQVSVDGVDIGGVGGGGLTVGGTLTNASTNGNGLDVGNSGITAATTLKVNGAGGLVNGNTAYINVVGSATVQATLNVADAAAGFGTAGVETGTVSLFNDALLEFKSGEISTIDGLLQLNGASAGVDDIGTPSGNSALTGLTTVAGSFYLLNGASLATSAGDNLTITGSGQVSVDGVDIGGGGGGSLTVGGALTNDSTSGNGLDVGNGGITAASKLTVNGSGGLANANTAYINITGNGSTAEAVLDVANAAAGFGTAGVETGTVSLTSNALLEFKSGEISTIDGALSLSGAQAQIDDQSTLSGNSALTGLTTVAGTFALRGGASLNTVSGTNLSITGSGQLSLDGANVGGPGGSSLTVGGTLINASTSGNALDIGNNGITASDTLTVNGAGGVTSSGSINIQGGVGTAAATLASAGTITTSGTIAVGSSGAPNSSVMTAPLVKVTGGLLEGVGSVNGAVDNTGGLVVGGLQYAAPASLTINGSYSQTTGGEVYADVDTSDSQQASVIAVTGGTGAPNAAGSVNISGGTLYVEGETSLALNTLYTVMTFAAGGFYGGFSAVKTGGALGNQHGNRDERQSRQWRDPRSHRQRDVRPGAGRGGRDRRLNGLHLERRQRNVERFERLGLESA